MGQCWVPGPVSLFVGTGSSGSPEYFCYSERGVSIAKAPRYSPYHTDFGGEEPIDWWYGGQSATVSGSISWWDESVYQELALYAEPVGGGSGVLGTDSPGDVGTLVGFEEAAVELWVVQPYSAKAAYSGMPAGWHFFQSYLDRDSLPSQGAHPSMLQLAWKCTRKVIEGQGSSLGPVSLKLYDHDMSAVSSMISTAF